MPSLDTAKGLGLKAELGLALCFDIQVQDGGIKKSARAVIERALAKRRPSAEQDLGRIIANAVAEVASKAYKEDVSQRKLTIASGEGIAHGHNFVLDN